MEGVLHCAVPRVIPSGRADHPARVYWPASHWQLDLLLVKPEIDLPRATQFRKLAKDQIDGGSNPCIRIFLDTVFRAFDVPDRDPSNQGAPLRLLQQRTVRTLGETREFHLAAC